MNEDKELMIKIFSAIKAVEDIEKDLAAIGDIIGNYAISHLKDKEVFMKFIEWLSKTPNTSKSYNAFSLRKFLYADTPDPKS